MTDLRYKPIPRRTREEILKLLSGGDPTEIQGALISAAYGDHDWRWAQEQVLRFAEDNDPVVLRGVALGLSYIAIFHGEIDIEKVEPVLKRLKALPELAGQAEDVEDDIDIFVKRRKGKAR